MRIFPMAAHRRESPAPLRETLGEIPAASESKLSMTRQACLDWARAHCAELVDGSLGSNLFARFSMLVRFSVTDVVLDFLEQPVFGALTQRKRAFDPKLVATITRYMRAVALRVRVAETNAKLAPIESDCDNETSGEHPAGMGKFTRTMFARDLRRTLKLVAVDARAPSAPGRYALS